MLSLESGRLQSLMLCIALLVSGACGAQPQAETPAQSNENVADLDSQIQVGRAKVDDKLIAGRIKELFANIDALADVTSEVNSGVVRLTGSTASKQVHEQALRVVQRVDGVVAVNDQIIEDRNIARRMHGVVMRLEDNLFETLAYLPLLIVALLVFALFWMVAALVTRWDAPYKRITRNPFLESLLKQIVRGAIILGGFIALLQILDATAVLGTVLGAAGILGLAIGFAIRDTVENYLASILLSLRQPFNANDHVEIEGHEGLVMRLTSRETVLMTLEGNHVRIPNATVYKSILTNYSRNPKRRFSFEVGVDTAVNLNAARALGISSLAGTPGVLESPPPACRIQMLGDSNVVLMMLGWVDQNEHDFSKVRSEAIRSVKLAFDTANYEMPEPIYRVKVEGLGSVSEPVSVATPTKPKQPPLTEEAGPAPDVAREHFIEQQIAQEKHGDEDGEDLLATDENNR